MTEVRKYSRKREAILEAIRSSVEHPNAEWIYSRLKPEYSDLSLGTVYRNLAVFRQEGKIMSVATVSGQERFDGNVAPHAHFICTSCGRVIDVEAEIPQSEIELAGKAVGGEVLETSLLFRGICGDCRSKYTIDKQQEEKQ